LSYIAINQFKFPVPSFEIFF